MQQLTLTSPAFTEGGWIPLDHTARGKDLSPELRLSGLDVKAVSLAVTMDDASYPLFPNYNHWVLWNVPAQEVIPAAIPAGGSIPVLSGAIQGVAYGRNRYKGPKPPLKAVHSYTFTVYVLDCTVSLPPHCRRTDLLAEIEGHILQRATLTGKFQNGRRR
ncbi:YbhB/YbcL family Raf kinase inhibitor-like protein [Clostridium sp. D33t1_170424_F3]|uniref:YbhB/YbcL family Raf kinase inhibitor-like protein n=1 Tax=Clostridium sp. D33t1_170424_F3 TaxID=2787099 RepID=UPI0018A986AE|nr:YbhB/YbcL family Raf kinase inhibitor-like protein [Clostridium sp. D33t1_170424_F3]